MNRHATVIRRIEKKILDDENEKPQIRRTMSDAKKLVSDKPLDHPLIQKLASLKAKLKQDEARPAAHYSNGVEDAAGLKAESIARTKAFIKQVESDPEFPKTK